MYLREKSLGMAWTGLMCLRVGTVVEWIDVSQIWDSGDWIDLS
jgi:hypothetical protein